MRWFWMAAFFLLWLLSAGWLQAGRDCLLVRGALGDPAFQESFAEMESAWRQAAEQAGDVRFLRVAGKAEWKGALHKLPAESEELWIVLVGHGTDDGRTAKFNLEGEDVSAAELASWLASWTRPLIVINSASASGSFIPALSGKNRVVVTATQSGTEVYAPKFGLHFARVLGAPEADLDRDGAVSVLEATVVAANRVTAEYAAGNQLASEHALVDDNGDGKGTRADWFEGVKLVKQPKGEAAADGNRARQCVLVRSRADRGLTGEERRRRAGLESRLDDLKKRRQTMEEAAFFREAEAILLELGKLMAPGSQGPAAAQLRGSS